MRGVGGLERRWCLLRTLTFLKYEATIGYPVDQKLQVYPNGDGGGRGADVCIIGILGAGKGTENGTGAGAGECWMTSHV